MAGREMVLSEDTNGVCELVKSRFPAWRSLNVPTIPSGIAVCLLIAAGNQLGICATIIVETVLNSVYLPKLVPSSGWVREAEYETQRATGAG